jgi:hypothetical protein
MTPKKKKPRAKQKPMTRRKPAMWCRKKHQLDRIEAKLDALILQGPALEALKADLQHVTAAMADSSATLEDATRANQPKPKEGA